ncbi:CYTH and CHAD domain-containing protein [Kitasatospora sp. NPDC097691]|uniref:CYTH and CHAD domain-containing protein n=1 Tax=Kitasatospora sp. NPDC097691 TaxID=3157231 RepID=UPI0033182D28
MSRQHKETERSYEGALRGPISAAGLPGVASVRTGTTQRLDAVYFDTPDLRLLRRGVTLRRRTGGPDAGWHLKTPQPDGSRTETRLPPDGRRNRPPAELTARAAVHARGGRLDAVAHLRTRRDPTLLLDEGGCTLAEIDRDAVSAGLIGPGGTTSGAADWTETEVEAATAGPRLLDAVEERLLAGGLQPSASGTKLGRALHDRLAELPAGAPAARPAGPDAPESAGDCLTACLRTHVAALESLDAAVRLDEPDAVHRMRVHVRRLRSALAAHQRLLRKGSVDDIDDELRRLGRILGRARDAEVLGRRLTTGAADLPPDLGPRTTCELLETVFRDRYETAWRSAVQEMRRPRYFALLGTLEDLAADPPLRGRARRGRREAGKVLARQRKRTARRLRAALDLAPGHNRDEALHRARKAAKRARYAAECTEPLLGKPARRLAQRTKRVQKALGAHQDGVVGERAVRELAAGAPHDVAFRLGVLHARQRRDADHHVAVAAKAGRKLGV